MHNSNISKILGMDKTDKDAIAICAVFRCEVEVNVQFGETALLWGAVASLQNAYGTTPGLQIQTAAQKNLYCRWKEAQDIRVQTAYEVEATGDEELVVSDKERGAPNSLWYRCPTGLQV